MLKAVGWESVQGHKPRFVCLDPRGTRLFAANENSHRIVVFSIDANTGTLVPTSQIIETGSPSCIVFATQ
jgi:6-phosphogluconolactonase